MIAGLSHCRRDDPFGTDLKDIASRGPQRRDRRHRRGVRQRPEGAAAGASPAKRRSRSRSAIQIMRRAGRPAWRRAGAASSACASCRRSASATARCPACRWPRTRCSPRTAAAWSAGRLHRASARRARSPRACIERLRRAHAAAPSAPARSLSGGNLQKFIVGREILQEPKVLVVSQPTWGVDVGAAAFIHQALIDAAQRRRRRPGDLARIWTSCSRSATASRSSPRGGCRRPMPTRETHRRGDRPAG